MKEIPLTHGRVAWVDDEDFETLSRWKWFYHVNGYAIHSTYAGGKNVHLSMHRFLLGAVRGSIVDHIDGNRLNNQRKNLRIVTAAQNNQNSVRQTQSGLKGVRLQRGLFRATIYYADRPIPIGTFEDPLEAAAAYDRKAVELYGSDALTNEKIISANLKKLQSFK